MARTVEDCALLLAGMTGAGALEPRSLAGLRLGVSSRIGELDPDVAAGFDATLELCRSLGVELVQAPPARETLGDWVLVLLTDMLRYHHRFDDRRMLYRPSIRQFVVQAEGLGPVDYDALQAQRLVDAEHWERWFAAERIAALLEPTVPDVAWLRGPGYDVAGSDVALISLTHHWDWTGQPAAALPAGLGAKSGLPVSVSLIGPAGSDWELLGLGAALQAEY